MSKATDQLNARQVIYDSVSRFANIARISGREQFLELRRQFIGSSDAPTLVGEKTYKDKSPYSIFLSKVRPIESDAKEPEHLRAGNIFEGAILQEYADNYAPEGVVVLSMKNETFLSKMFPYCGANLDGVQYDPDSGELTIVEIKNVRTKSEFLEGIGCSRYHWLQVQYQMAITGIRRAVVFSCVGGNSFNLSEVIEYDQAVGEEMLSVSDYFYFESVINGVIPTKGQEPVDVFPNVVNDQLAEPSLSDLEIAKTLDEVRTSLKTLEAEKERLEDLLKFAIGERKGIRGVATWTNQNATRLDQKALKESEPEVFKKYSKTSSSRVFRFKFSDDEQ